MSNKPFAIVVGVGAGTGASAARRLAKSYPVALLARSAKFSQELAAEINAEGGRAVSYQMDVASEESVKSAFAKIEGEFGTTCAAAVFNASGRPFPKPFLWQAEADLRSGLDITLVGAFLFSQAALPLLLNAVGHTDLAPTLIFTGATAAVKANAWLQPFNVPKHALRGHCMALHREFAPQGVHVAHVIVDGVIRMPLTWWLKPLSSWNAKLDPEAIAESYWNLHAQPAPHFTPEVAIRPYCEKW